MITHVLVFNNLLLSRIGPVINMGFNDVFNDKMLVGSSLFNFFFLHDVYSFNDFTDDILCLFVLKVNALQKTMIIVYSWLVLWFALMLEVILRRELMKENENQNKNFIWTRFNFLMHCFLLKYLMSVPSSTHSSTYSSTILFKPG